MERIIEIDFAHCFKEVFRKWLALLLAAIFGAIIGWGYFAAFLGQENLYMATASVSCINIEDVSVVPFYAEIAKTTNVANRAADLLGNSCSANDIISMVSVQYEDNIDSGIPIIEIQATSTDQDQIVRVSNAVADAFITEIQSLTNTESARKLGNTSVISMVYSAKKTMFYCIVGVAVICALLLAAFIFIRAMLAFKLETIRDGILDGKLKLLGVIPRFADTGKSKTTNA